MNRAQHHETPVELGELSPGSFVFFQPDALGKALCADIVSRFESHPEEHYAGRIGQRARPGHDVKKSTDLVISGKPHWHDIDRALFTSLSRAMQTFRLQYPFFKNSFKDMGYAIQRTTPGEYYAWHVDGGSHDFSHRQLVAIWYLNDVPGPGGETEFAHQRLKVKPQAGMLILFPPFWTHEHRGVLLEEGNKYIATTWVVFA